MVYSEARIVVGVLAHVPVLIFIANFIKGKFGIKTEETKDASFDRCHFTDFGDFSLNFELVYYITTNNYLAAMEAQQSINLRIIEEFAVNNIEFAFPTQTLNIESNKAK